MHTVLWGFTGLEPVIDQLTRSKTITVREWICKPPIGTRSIYSFFDNSFETMQGHRVPVDMEELYDECYLEFVQMFSRHDHYTGNITPQDEYEHIFFRTLNFFARLLEEKAIELVLFSGLPHEGPDFLLYHVARKMHVNCLILSHFQFLPRFFYMTDFYDYGRFDFMRTAHFESGGASLPEIGNYYYMKSAPFLDYQNEIFKVQCQNKHFGLAQRDKYLTYHAELQKIEEDYVPSDVPFVYFPLHLQPELTTSALGGKYCNQLLAIACLSQIIPDNWRILVKENPKQIHSYRGNFFFKSVASLPKVHFIKRKTDTLTLTKDSRFIATITGTAGFEGLSLGKRVLVFGRPWYLTLPGVHRYDKTLDVDQLTRPVEREQLAQGYSELVSRMPLGVPYKDLLEQFPQQMADNDVVLATTLRVLIRELFKAPHLPA